MFGQITPLIATATEILDAYLQITGSPQAFANMSAATMTPEQILIDPIQILFRQIYPGIVGDSTKYVPISAEIAYTPALAGFPTWSIFLLLGMAVFMFLGKKK